MPMEWLTQLARRALDAWHQRAIVLKAVSFAIVGLVNSAVDFGVFSFAYYYLALTGSYVMNSLTTFARESKRELTMKAYVGFAVSQIAGLVANTATVVVASYFMPVLIGKLLAIAASFLVNFSLSHFLVFRKRPDTAQRER
jgi:putative flippase GtrA